MAASAVRGPAGKFCLVPKSFPGSTRAAADIPQGRVALPLLFGATEPHPLSPSDNDFNPEAPAFSPSALPGGIETWLPLGIEGLLKTCQSVKL